MSGHTWRPIQKIWQRLDYFAHGAPGQGLRHLAGRLRLSKLRRPEWLPFCERIGPQRLELSEAQQQMADQFRGIGSHLESLTRLSDQLVKQSEALLDISAPREDGLTVLTAAIRQLAEPLDFLSRCEEQTARLLQRLELHNGDIGRHLRAEEDLLRTTAPLKYLQTLFKTESAALGAEQQQMFLSLTQSIERLHGQVRAVFADQFEKLGSMRVSLTQIIAHQRNQAQDQHRLVEAKRGQIRAALIPLERDAQLDRDRHEQLNRFSRQLDADAGKAVVGMQFQDITSQKLAHVLDALAEIAAPQHPRSPRPTAGAALLLFLHQCARIQIEQLRVVGEELAQAESDIRSGIQEIATEARDLCAQCLALRNLEAATSSGTAVVQVLLNNLGELTGVVSVAGGALKEAAEGVRPLRGLAFNLTGKIRELSAEMHLIGLNAQVLSAKVGERTGLEVLSAKASDIARQTTQCSEHVAVGLNQLARELEETVQTYEQLRHEGLVQEARLHDAVPQTTRELHAYRNQVADATGQISRLVETIQTEAEAAIQQTCFKNLFDPPATQLLETLQTLTPLLEQRLRELPPSPDTQQLVTQLKSRYTMASEHAAFDRALSPPVPPAPLATAAAVPSSPNRPATPVPVPVPLSTSVLPALETPATSLAPTAPPEPASHPETLVTDNTPKEEFGDNVELF